jgi:hypothetical protein
MKLRGHIIAAMIVAIPMIVGCDLTVQQFLDGQQAYQAGDYDTALFLWRPMAELDNAGAQYGLGTLYAEGKGVPRDDVEAAKWFRKAAQQGHAKAQIVLGYMYINGVSVPQDYVQGYMWLNIASANDYEVARQRDEIAAKLTPAQIAEAQALARAWTARYGKKSKPPITAKTQ